MLTQEQKDFLLSRLNDRTTVSVGYVNHLDSATVKQYAAIYKEHIDSKFIYNSYCDACRFDMVKKVFEHLGDQLFPSAPPTIEVNQDETTRRTRKPK